MHRIAIVGGGIGGLVTATHLARRLSGSDKAEVLLVDRNRAHVWKPMLHTFAAGTSDYANENVSFIPHAREINAALSGSTPGFVKRTSGRSLCAPSGELSDESYS